MKEQHYLILFGLLAILQLSFAGRMVFQQEKIMQKGVPYLFKTAPVDPNDPFRGKYISLRFEAEQFETNDLSEWKPQEEVYVCLYNDAEGFAKVNLLSRTPPQDDTPYFKASIRSFYTRDSSAYIQLSFPFSRYYMEESKALEAETAYREAFQKAAENIYAVVFINNGQSSLEDVKIGETSIKELATQSKR